MKSVFTITVDNASSNDVVVGYVKKKLMSWGASTVRCKFLHMRCIAHILNLVVNDGLKEANRAVKKVRECVRFIRSSPAYLRKFKELSELAEIDYKSSLVLDIAIRWNSAYLMLKIACQFQRAFEKYEEDDTAFRVDLVDDIPDILDWLIVKKLVDMLEVML